MDKLESGELEYNRIVYDAIVMEIDNVGGQFDGDNPVDSIKYRLISNMEDRFFKDVNLEIAWPLFSIHTRQPLKIGERVKILFDRPGSVFGSWFSTRHSRDNPNFKAWNDISEPDESQKSKEAFGDNTEEEDPLELSDITLQKNSAQIQEDPHLVKQEFPQLLKSNDEHVEQGSNNSLTRYGRDRPNTIDSGLEAGAIDDIVGLNDQNPSWENDKGRDYLAEKSDIDKDLPNPSLIDAPAASAKAIKADLIRLNADRNMVLWVGDVWIVINAGKVSIGGTGGNATGELVTQESVCRHVCPWLAWVNAGGAAPEGVLFPPPATTAATMGITGKIVESHFGTDGETFDGSESNENVEILD